MKQKYNEEDDHDEEVYVPKKQQFMEQLYQEREKELKQKKAQKNKKKVNVWGQGIKVYCLFMSAFCKLMVSTLNSKIDFELLFIFE